MQFDILSKTRVTGVVSLVLVIASIILLGVIGLPTGIDFTSGTSITYQWGEEDDPGSAAVREALTQSGHPEAIIQNAGSGQYFVRTSDLGATGKSDVDAALDDISASPPVTLDVTTVGRSVASNTVLYSFIAVIVAALFVMVYVMWAFRSVLHSYRFAVAALVALVHDVLITVGMFVIYGFVFGSEVNAPFIVAVLTVIGYSVNDTIVVFDRIRENSVLVPSRPFKATVSLSIKETLIRSLGTSVTTLIVVFAMLLFGGQTIQDFLLVLATGIIVGTYSSIFVASYLLVLWEEHGLGALRNLIDRRGPATNSGRVQ